MCQSLRNYIRDCDAHAEHRLQQKLEVLWASHIKNTNQYMASAQMIQRGMRFVEAEEIDDADSCACNYTVIRSTALTRFASSAG